MVYDKTPPYTVQQTNAADAKTMQRFVRFSRYWDCVANSGRFKNSLRLLLEANAAASPFYAFLAFAGWLWQRSGRTNGLSPELLVDALFDYLCAQSQIDANSVRQALLDDYLASGARGSPQALKGLLPKRGTSTSHARALVQRQSRHLAVRQSVD